jgi:hypothetical protein
MNAITDSPMAMNKSKIKSSKEEKEEDKSIEESSHDDGNNNSSSLSKAQQQQQSKEEHDEDESLPPSTKKLKREDGDANQIENKQMNEGKEDCEDTLFDHCIFNHPHLAIEDAEKHRRFIAHLFENAR